MSIKGIELKIINKLSEKISGEFDGYQK